jgi:hypothetical protein
MSASLTLLMLGMLGLVVLMDVGATSSGVGLFARVAYWSMAIGVGTGLLALTVQLVDLVTTPAQVAGRPHLGILSAGTTAMLVTFAVLWWARDDGRPSSGALLAVEAVAFLVGLAAAVYARWFLAGGQPPRPVAVVFPLNAYRRHAPLAGHRPPYGRTVPYRIPPNRSTVPLRTRPMPLGYGPTRPSQATTVAGYDYRRLR